MQGRKMKDQMSGLDNAGHNFDHPLHRVANETNQANSDLVVQLVMSELVEIQIQYNKKLLCIVKHRIDYTHCNTYSSVK